MSSEEGPTRGQKKEQGYLEKVLDKVQKKRRGEKSSDSAVDKAIEKAQELAELREAGAITDEEFEEKKKELLERM